MREVTCQDPSKGVARVGGGGGQDTADKCPTADIPAPSRPGATCIRPLSSVYLSLFSLSQRLSG